MLIASIYTVSTIRVLPLLLGYNKFAKPILSPLIKAFKPGAFTSILNYEIDVKITKKIRTNNIEKPFKKIDELSIGRIRLTRYYKSYNVTIIIQSDKRLYSKL